jgi:hypothetical protein
MNEEQGKPSKNIADPSEYYWDDSNRCVTHIASGWVLGWQVRTGQDPRDPDITVTLRSGPDEDWQIELRKWHLRDPVVAEMLGVPFNLRDGTMDFTRKHGAFAEFTFADRHLDIVKRIENSEVLFERLAEMCLVQTTGKKTFTGGGLEFEWTTILKSRDWKLSISKTTKR